MYQVDILVNGKAVDVYQEPNSSDLYIEGRSGSEYELNLRNNSFHDAEFVVSIDGLSIVDGEPASAQSRGYVVKARSSTNIKGWLVDDKTVAKFKFGERKNSYSEKSGHGEANVGVIGVLVFRKQQPQYELTRFFSPTWNAIPYNSPNLNPPQFDWVSNNFTPSYSSSSTNSGPELSSFSHPEEIHLGTEFGDAASVNTNRTVFLRDPRSTPHSIILYYETAKQLNARGITLKWQKTNTKPNPFPGEYCEPPAGWSR